MKKIVSQGDTRPSSQPTFFAPDKTAKNVIPLELSLYAYDEHGQGKSVELSKHTMEQYFPNSAFTEKPLILFWPICLDNIIYEPSNFERLLRGALQPYKGKVHVVILLPDELDRHNAGKAYYFLNPEAEDELDQQEAEESIELDDDHYSQGFEDNNQGLTSCLEANDQFRADSVTKGLQWLNSAHIDLMEQNLECNITVFSWKDITSTVDFRSLFIQRLQLRNKEPILPCEIFSIEKLARFVKSKLSKNGPFLRAVSPLLNYRNQKDAEAYPESYNINIGNQCNQHYLAEEIAVTMKTLGNIGDLINSFIQPERKPSKRKSSATTQPKFGELLDYWTRTLLTEFVKGKVDFKQDQRIYHYVTAYYNSFSLSLADRLSHSVAKITPASKQSRPSTSDEERPPSRSESYEPINSARGMTPSQHSSPSLAEMCISAVMQRGGIVTLTSASDRAIFSLALELVKKEVTAQRTPESYHASDSEGTNPSPFG